MDSDQSKKQTKAKPKYKTKKSTKTKIELSHMPLYFLRQNAYVFPVIQGYVPKRVSACLCV